MAMPTVTHENITPAVPVAEVAEDDAADGAK